MYSCSVFFFANLSMSFHVVRHCNGFRTRFFPSRQFFSCSSRNTLFEHFLRLIIDKIRSDRIHVQCIPSIRDREMMLVHPGQHSSSISSTWQQYAVSFQQFICRPQVLKRIIPAFDEQKRHSQFRTFSHPSSNKNFIKLSLP